MLLGPASNDSHEVESGWRGWEGWGVEECRRVGV